MKRGQKAHSAADSWLTHIFINDTPSFAACLQVMAGSTHNLFSGRQFHCAKCKLSKDSCFQVKTDHAGTKSKKKLKMCKTPLKIR